MTVQIDDPVADALHRLAIARGAALDTETTGVYLDALADLEPGLIRRACAALSLEPRAAYETVLPAVAVIRQRVSALAREDQQAEQRAKVLPWPKEDEPLYFCTSCYDEPNGWQICWCPGDERNFESSARALSTRMCACGRDTKRGRPHTAHTYADRCPCYATNPVIQRRKEAERRRQQERER